ncbi:unnamed protein product [Linum trigynum]|uniref:F-box domain-containing protein n=1 Tax=Linum trigynum TaxID=586398 RepID=A0AAV2EPF2_9ROSI
MLSFSVQEREDDGFKRLRRWLSPFRGRNTEKGQGFPRCLIIGRGKHCCCVETMASNNVSGSEKIDRISALPDGILVEILSLLTLIEAVRTSVLSQRWIDVWKFVPDLDFHALAVRLRAVAINGRLEVRLLTGDEVRLQKHVSGVNQVLEQHRSPKVNHFRLSLELNYVSNPDADIDRLMVFPISKRVERLELDFGDSPPGKRSCVLSEPSLNYIRTAEGLSNIRFLKSLILKHVDLGSDTLEHFLCNCPLLDKLVVWGSYYSLVNFKVPAGTGLKHLDVNHCSHLKAMEIHAPKLKYLRYAGPRIDLRMENVCSSILELEWHIWLNDYSVLHPPNMFTQLEALTLMISTDRRACFLDSVEDLASLKQLTVFVDGRCDACALGLIPLINSCPCLHHLSIRLLTCGDSRELVAPTGEVEMKRESVRLVEVTGFAGASAFSLGTHFVDYAIRNFVMLEKLVLDRRMHPCHGNEITQPLSKDDEDADACLEGLKPKLPSNIELVTI